MKIKKIKIIIMKKLFKLNYKYLNNYIKYVKLSI